VTLSIALDLGSTRIKAGRLTRAGRVADIVSEPAPPLRRDGLVREGDAEEYRRAAERVLERAGAPADVPLGIASQRSSFLLWDRASGAPATPLISWQDRRAASWCERNGRIADRVTERTGLPLSPHYVGPKLASLIEADAVLARRLRAGELALGTLDTYLVWKWSAGRALRTDPTMAARTLLFDPRAGDWCGELMERFGAARELLAAVEPSAGRGPVLLDRWELRASIADQASGAIALAGGETDVAIVNCGTGCFVLRPTGELFRTLPGYLAGPSLAACGRTRFALEGTINGGAAACDRFGRAPTVLPEADPSPDAFCLPDSAGVGSPHWRPGTPFTLSESAALLSGGAKRRIVLEGLLFRVREILEDLCAGEEPASVIVCGGLTRDPFLAEGLAACLGREVAVAAERESTLAGAARLAAGTAERRPGAGSVVAPGARGAYLARKFERWRSWLRGVLGG
jgi:glycerol kinase